MEIIYQFSTALGLAGLCGINLYLTVLVAGLALRFHWITLAPQYAQLEILAHPALLGIAGVLFTLQFFADKIPWLDSLWDALQTFIRPVGGACLAVLAMGHSHPLFNVAVALIGGGVALTSHTAKAGTHLAVNTSPAPFSHIFLSLAEDAGVIGALILIYLKPGIALVVELLLLLSLLFLLPHLLARMGMILWLIKNKLNAPAWKAQESILPTWVPSAVNQQIERLCTTSSSSKIAWALPCATRNESSTFPSSLRGWLVALAPSSSPLYFVGKKGWRWFNLLIPVEGLLVQVENGFLSEDLVFSDQKNKPHTFLFPRSLTQEIRLAEKDIHRRIEFSSSAHLIPQKTPLSPCGAKIP